MKWYVVKIVFQIESSSTVAQFDEQIRLISAISQEEAVELADAIGRKEDEDLTTVKWKYLGISHLKELANLKNGIEVCSSTHEVDDAPHYIDFVKRKDIDMHQHKSAEMKLAL